MIVLRFAIFQQKLDFHLSVLKKLNEKRNIVNQILFYILYYMLIFFYVMYSYLLIVLKLSFGSVSEVHRILFQTVRRNILVDNGCCVNYWLIIGYYDWLMARSWLRQKPICMVSSNVRSKRNFNEGSRKLEVRDHAENVTFLIKHSCSQVRVKYFANII